MLVATTTLRRPGADGAIARAWSLGTSACSWRARDHRGDLLGEPGDVAFAGDEDEQIAGPAVELAPDLGCRDRDQGSRPLR